MKMIFSKFGFSLTQCFGLLLVLLLFSSSACGQKKPVQTNGDQIQVDNLAGGLNHPWGMAFLPDGRLLLTERAGRLRILNTDSSLSEPIAGVPEVFSRGQGGLLDVALDPDFGSNQLVYLSFSENGDNGTASTALGRGRLNGQQLENFEVIFRQEPKVDGPNHFGGRIAFTPNGTLFLTLGERFKFDPAQDLSNHLGAIVHLNRDGSIPQNNPFASQENAAKATWSYGHRNIEAAAIDPNTGRLWVAEMGPKGGDELNQPEAGKNYGWPLVSWGNHYDGRDIPDPPTRPELADAVVNWTPVISPSGMIFYSGDQFPQWKNHMLIGGLTAKGVVVVQVNEGQAKEVDRIPLNARIRDVAQAPDGSIYVLTDEDNGNVWRLRK